MKEWKRRAPSIQVNEYREEGIPYSKGAEHVGIKQREEGRIQPQPQRNRPNHRCGEHGGAAEGADRIPHVLPKRVEKADAAGVATLILYEGFRAEADARVAPRVVFLKTGSEVLPCLHLEMERQLLLELAIDSAATRNGPEPKPQIAHVHHGRLRHPKHAIDGSGEPLPVGSFRAELLSPGVMVSDVYITIR